MSIPWKDRKDAAAEGVQTEILDIGRAELKDMKAIARAPWDESTQKDVDSLPFDGNGQTIILEFLQVSKEDVVDSRALTVMNLKIRALERGDISAKVVGEGENARIAYVHPDGSEWVPPPEFRGRVLVQDNIKRFSAFLKSRMASKRKTELIDSMVLGKGEPQPNEQEEEHAGGQ